MESDIRHATLCSVYTVTFSHCNNLLSSDYYYPHLTDDITEAESQKQYSISSRSHLGVVFIGCEDLIFTQDCRVVSFGCVIYSIYSEKYFTFLWPFRQL